MQRTEKLLCFLMTMDQLADEDREAIWRTTDMNDLDMQTEMLKSLQGTAPHMKFEDRHFFLERLASVEDVSDRHVDLVKEFYNYNLDLAFHYEPQ